MDPQQTTRSPLTAVPVTTAARTGLRTVVPGDGGDGSADGGADGGVTAVPMVVLTVAPMVALTAVLTVAPMAVPTGLRTAAPVTTAARTEAPDHHR